VGFLEALGAAAHAVGEGVAKVGKAIGDAFEETVNAGADAAEDTAEAGNRWAADNLPAPLAAMVGVAVAVFVAGVEIVRGIGNAIAEGIRIFTKIVGYVVGLGWVNDLVFWAFGVNKIVASDDAYDAPSEPRTSADCMTVALVPDAWGFSDSGPRRFFRINGGRIEWRDASIPGNDWSILAPPGETNPQAISYHRKRLGEPVAPAFDMVAANSGRVFAKEKDKCSFYFAMLEPMFRQNPNEPVQSAYFKLDPERGQSDATNGDRLVHLRGEDTTHPAAIRFPVFRMLMSVPLVDMMAVNIDRHRRVWHLIDARPPSASADPPSGGFFPPTKEVVTYESNGLFKQTQSRRAYRIRRVLDIGVGHEQWHEHESTIYGGEMDSLDGPGLPEVLPERNAYRFFNGPVNDKGGFIDGTINYYALCQFVDEETADCATPPPGAFGILWLDEQAALSQRWRLLHPRDSKFSGFADIVPSAIVQYLDRDATYGTLRFDQSKFWCPFRAGSINRFSRMAVSRQVVVTSGFDRKAGRAGALECSCWNNCTRGAVGR
jgi:hypothetical protein